MILYGSNNRARYAYSSLVLSKPRRLSVLMQQQNRASPTKVVGPLSLGLGYALGSELRNMVNFIDNAAFNEIWSHGKKDDDLGASKEP